MVWLVDIDKLVAEGLIPPPLAEEMKRRSRREALSFGINLFLIGGIATVLAGAIALEPAPANATFTGLAVTILAAIMLAAGGQRWRLLANAMAVIGLALAGVGALWWMVETTESIAPAVIGGGVAAAVGLIGVWTMERRWSIACGWLAVLGISAHVAGLADVDTETLGPWALAAWSGTLLLAAGLAIDVRVLTALSVFAFAGAVAATGYERGLYWLAVPEPTLLILVFVPLTVLAGGLAERGRERFARHGRILGLIAVIWMCIAFWIGSLWGDWPGETVWAPARNDFEDWSAWRAARDAWRETAVEIAPAVFAVIWALFLAALAVWAAATARRALFNAAATFGAIHFYTQWFERLEAEPVTIIAAGLIAIGIAFAMVRANAWLEARGTAPAARRPILRKGGG